MDYDFFTAEMIRRYAQQEGDREVLFFRDGFTSQDEAEQKWIRNTNIRFSKKDSDVLEGDFAVLRYRGDDSFSSRVPLRQLYSLFEREGWDGVEKELDTAFECLRTCNPSSMIGSLQDYDYARERIIIRPLNHTEAKMELKNTVCHVCGDIALVVYVVIREDPDTGLISAKIPADLLTAWQKDPEEVWNTAMRNTVKRYPPSFYSAADLMKAEGIAEDRDLRMKAQELTVLTADGVNGAAALFYPGMTEQIAQKLNDSYFAAFTSVSEVMIHPASTTDPIRIRESLQRLKQDCEGEILSSRVYYYDRKTKELKVYQEA